MQGFAFTKAPTVCAADLAVTFQFTSWLPHRRRTYTFVLLICLFVPSGERAQNNITTVAGDGFENPEGFQRGGMGSGRFSGDGGLAIRASLNHPLEVAVDSAGNLYIADFWNLRVRKVDKDGVIVTVAGGNKSFFVEGGQAADAAIGTPLSLTVDNGGNLFVLVTSHSLLKVSPNGTIITVAKMGKEGLSGDGGPVAAASLNFPLAVTVDANGNLYIAEEVSRVRKVNSEGRITTVAGNGVKGFSGDGGPALAASMSEVRGLAVDATGNLYIADTGNHRIRKVTPGGIITTIAGSGVQGFSGDGGSATTATLNTPFGVAADARGNVYIADTKNNRIRRVSLTGIITTIAGNGHPGFSGDGGPATNASLNMPMGLTIDPTMDLYIADSNNNRIRRVQGIAPPSLIAFSSRRAGNQEIYAIDLAVGTQTNLTNNPADDGYPRFSSNGSRIAFASNRNGNWEVYIMNSNGSAQRNLTNNSGDDGFMDWAPNGQSLVFASTRDGNRELYTIGVDGSGLRRLTNSPAEDVHPAWSPDGRRIAFASERDGNREIYVMNSDGTGTTRLTFNSFYDDYPAWSPDGSQIAFASDRDSRDSSRLEIYVLNADGSNGRRLTNDQADDRHPAWSPDGRIITFASNRSGDYEIFTMTIAGTDLRRLTNALGDDEHPHWAK